MFFPLRDAKHENRKIILIFRETVGWYYMYVVEPQILQRGLRDLRVTGKEILDVRVGYTVGQSETVY